MSGVLNSEDSSLAAVPKTLLLSDVDFGTEIGAGSTCTVHIARLRHTPYEEGPGPLAVKAISRRRHLTKKAFEHLLTERRLLEEVEHPCIVHFHKSFKDSDNVYYLMELMSRGTVLEHLQHEAPAAKASLAQVKHYAASVLLALRHLSHQNILYRDLNLKNVMVNHKGHVKLVDLGKAKRLGDPDDASESTCRTHTLCGTRHYFPPEALTQHGFCLASDRWALGVFISELLHNTPLFDYNQSAQDLHKTILAVPSSLPPSPWGGLFSSESEELVRMLLQKQPEDRPSFESIMAHPWFSDVNFDGILGGTETLGGNLPAVRAAVQVFEYTSRRRFATPSRSA
mmetsp:Transcript_13308/g.22470  ORF Transcript_13308/g.22470 Transcript_13308/m.22470 type:complete len:341 (+) Transcript_13308:179-1201(+)